MLSRLFVALTLMGVFATSVFAQADDNPEDSRSLSYFVCDWGLLTVVNRPANESLFVKITSPEDYSAVSGTAFAVSGEGAGLYEGNVIVEVRGDGGDVLFTGTTTLQTQELGQRGTWSIDVDLGALDGATRVVIAAYSTSPEDGSTSAIDDVTVNVNSEFVPQFVQITTPAYGAEVSTYPLVIEGQAGAAFENNIVVEVHDAKTGDLLAQTPATVQTDAIGGKGPFTADVTFDAEPGTAITIHAYQPQVADDEQAIVSGDAYAVVTPLARSYDQFLTIYSDDPLATSPDLCGLTGAEFDNQTITPLVINDVTYFEFAAPTPVVNLKIDAAGSSVCPAPIRTRTTHAGSDYTVEIYRDASQPVACTADLAPIEERISLATLPSPTYTVTVNGKSVK